MVYSYKIPTAEVVSMLEGSNIEFFVKKWHGYNHYVDDHFPIRSVLWHGLGALFLKLSIESGSLVLPKPLRYLI